MRSLGHAREAGSHPHCSHGSTHGPAHGSSGTRSTGGPWTQTSSEASAKACEGPISHRLALVLEQLLRADQVACTLRRLFKLCDWNPAWGKWWHAGHVSRHRRWQRRPTESTSPNRLRLQWAETKNDSERFGQPVFTGPIIVEGPVICTGLQLEIARGNKPASRPAAAASGAPAPVAHGWSQEPWPRSATAARS